MQERVEGPLMKSIKISLNGGLDHAEEQAPISGKTPNNAELLNEVDPAKLGSLSLPHPQHQQPILLGGTSITKYLRSLGAVKGASEDSATDTALLKPGLSERGGTPKETRNTRAQSQSSRSSHIDLDVDNYSYSREALDNCIKSGLPKFVGRQRTCSRSPDEYRRSVKRSLNRVPEEMEATPSDRGVESPTGTSHAPQNNIDVQRFYGSVGYGAPPPNPNINSRYVGRVFDEEDSDLSEEEEEWLLDEELAKQGLYRGECLNTSLVAMRKY